MGAVGTLGRLVGSVGRAMVGIMGALNKRRTFAPTAQAIRSQAMTYAAQPPRDPDPVEGGGTEKHPVR
jgi:hypothetical protein